MAVAGPRYSGDAEHGRNHFLQTGVASRHGVPATTEAPDDEHGLGPDGRKGASFEPLLRNTANPTVIRAGEQINVAPSKVEVDLDDRLLPGYSPEDLISELVAISGGELEL